MKSVSLTLAVLCVALAVGPISNGQTTGATIANVSLLVQVAPGASTPPLGFVGNRGNSAFLIRAVGPSLTAFGIQNPMLTPIIHVFDASGKDISLSVLAAVGGDLNGMDPWPTIYSEVGAFPLGGGQDAHMILTPPNKPCSITVKDANGMGGTILIEIYALPPGAIL